MHIASEVIFLNGLKATSQIDISMYVTYDGIKSNTYFLNCRVPQGSILGPLLFIIFINDLFNVSELLFTVLYADDACFLLGGKNLENLITCLNNELKNITTWLKSNKLTLNVNKTHYMIFHRARIKYLIIILRYALITLLYQNSTFQISQCSVRSHSFMDSTHYLCEK